MITRYRVTLTGAADALPDLALPASSLRVTHRAGSDSSYSIVVPTYDLIEGITARPHGQVVVTADEGGALSELMRGSVADVRADVGASSQSLTLSGAASQADPPEVTRALSGVSYLGTTDTGETRLRAAPVAALRPGDTVTWEGVAYLVDTVTWTARASAGSLQVQMELSTAAPEA